MGKIKINKKIIIPIILFIILVLTIIVIFLLKNDNKISNSVNNIGNKSLEEIEKYILNISSYKAELEVTVESNKNTNKYLLEQQYSGNSFKQVVREPSNIEGLEIIYENNNLKINNTKLNLSNIYENYNYIAGNFLSLDSFIEDYKKEKESQSKNYAIKSENNYVIMEVKPSNGNKYTSYKKIYIDRNTGNIAKLVIQDINKKNLVYILYNKIEINS